MHTKSIFAQHGIPEVVISDNGSQFSATSYAEFAKEYHFQHITSSPYFPQSNGEAERAVGAIKALLNEEQNPYLAILAYRSTPLQVGYSPSELLMSRKIGSTVPLSKGKRREVAPRSYAVVTPTGETRRNKRDLIQIPETEERPSSPSQIPETEECPSPPLQSVPPQPNISVRGSTRHVNMPDYYCWN